MNNTYTKDVRRFGGPNPYVNEDGQRFYLSHADNIDPSAMKTDGLGNVDDVPLIRRKPCFGRPERYARALRPALTWTDDKEERRFQQTPCDGCRDGSPGVFEACGMLVSERIDCSPKIKAAFHAWDAACGHRTGQICFRNDLGSAWDQFLQSIVDHGGWTNSNDENVKLDALKRRQADQDRANKLRREARSRERDARKGKPPSISAEYLAALSRERDRRADHLLELSRLSSAPRWLTKLPPIGRERTADVWESRELITRAGRNPTGTDIANRLSAKYPNLSTESLAARVYDDLKRISKLEDDRDAAPVWPRWTYTDGSASHLTP
jgi:hypothetical protein